MDVCRMSNMKRILIDVTTYLFLTLSYISLFDVNVVKSDLLSDFLFKSDYHFRVLIISVFGCGSCKFKISFLPYLGTNRILKKKFAGDYFFPKNRVK